MIKILIIYRKTDDITEKRREIIDDIILLCSQNDNIIIDIICVTAEVDVLLERVKWKDLYDASRGDTEYLKSTERSLKYMDLFKNYNVTYVQSNPNYEFVVIPHNNISLSRGKNT